MTSVALLGCHWAGDVSAQNTPYMRGVMAVGTSRTLKFFLASLCVLSFIAVANIVGLTVFLHSPARFHAVLRFSAFLSPPEQQRGPQSHGWSSVDAGSTSTTLRSGASLPSRTYPVSSTPSRRSDITRLSSKSFASTTVVSPTTVRPLECDRCFVHNYPSVIRNPGICASDRGDVIDLLLLITTVHSHLRARQAQRGTWLSVARGNRGNVRYVYLLGETFNDTVREALLKENATYGDLLMEGFKDTYRNLTLKTMMGMNWAVTLCPKARYVMKTDDDMWVNVRSVLNLTRTHAKDLQTRVAGACRGRWVLCRLDFRRRATLVDSSDERGAGKTAMT